MKPYPRPQLLAIAAYLDYIGCLGVTELPAARVVSGSAMSPPETPPSSLDEVRRLLGGCERCPLAKTRTHVVFGTGNPESRLVFVGEGPGEEEDRQGEPFVGKAGRLLDLMIAAMGLSRPDVYIANVVKCRPPANRNPLVDEIEACAPFLAKQLAVIRPEVIIALGRVAAQTLLQSQKPISVLRGRFDTYWGTAVMPTYHPAYLLRNPQAKGAAWEDLQQVMARLNLPGRVGS